MHDVSFAVICAQLKDQKVNSHLIHQKYVRYVPDEQTLILYPTIPSLKELSLILFKS